MIIEEFESKELFAYAASHVDAMRAISISSNLAAKFYIKKFCGNCKVEETLENCFLYLQIQHLSHQSYVATCQQTKKFRYF